MPAKFEDPNTAEHNHEPPQLSEGTLGIVRRMRRAFLAICRCGDVMFSPYRLTTEQYALMRAVQRQPGIRQIDLRSVIVAEPNTVTAMVTLLEKRGILRRKASPSDGRVRLLFLTAHGQAVLQRLSNDWEPMRAVLRSCFDGKAGDEALAILDRVYEEMEHEREKLAPEASSNHTAETDAHMPASGEKSSGRGKVLAARRKKATTRSHLQGASDDNS